MVLISAMEYKWQSIFYFKEFKQLKIKSIMFQIFFPKYTHVNFSKLLNAIETFEDVFFNFTLYIFKHILVLNIIYQFTVYIYYLNKRKLKWFASYAIQIFYFFISVDQLYVLKAYILCDIIYWIINATI